LHPTTTNGSSSSSNSNSSSTDPVHPRVQLQLPAHARSTQLLNSITAALQSIGISTAEVDALLSSVLEPLQDTMADIAARPVGAGAPVRVMCSA
jgi:hypothetical protein